MERSGIPRWGGNGARVRVCARYFHLLVPRFFSRVIGLAERSLLSLGTMTALKSIYYYSSPAKKKLWAIEIKYGLSPKPTRGFHQAIEDLEAEKAFVVYSGEERFPLSETTEAISLRELSMILS